jgi:HPt (histidine-containing phosphotransfer) domain-containing protein
MRDQHKPGHPQSDQSPITIEVDADLEPIMKPFFEERQKDIATIERCLKSGELQPVYTIGHRMKGIAANFGFPVLGDLGEKLETASQSGDKMAVKRHCQFMKDYLARVKVKYKPAA